MPNSVLIFFNLKPKSGQVIPLSELNDIALLHLFSNVYKLTYLMYYMYWSYFNELYPRRLMESITIVYMTDK